MKKLATAILTIAFLTAAWPLAMGASPETAAPMAFGMEAGAIKAQTDAGVAPDIGTFWVGPWTLKHGWGGPDADMQRMRDAGITPAIHFYYWGDDISQDCITNGCYSDLHGAWKDQAGWDRLATELIDHLHAKMQGKPVYILLETEFNKADLQYYEPLDAMLADKAKQIKAGYPEADVVLSLGNWNRPAWTTWDRAAAASDLIGIQGMRGSTRDSVSHYESLYEETLAGAKDAKRIFAKPVIIQDLALSSYPEPEYLEKQRAELAQFFDNLGDLKAAGVEALVYRSWYNNPNFDLNNYYKEAERHWGLHYAPAQGGHAKPAADVWVQGVTAERASASSGSLAPAAPAPAFTATFAPSPNNNEWWVDVKVTSNHSPVKVEAKHSGGSYVGLDATGWGTWAKSFHAPAGGEMVFRATDADGQRVVSEAFPWLEAPNQPPIASFKASSSGLAASLDASASSDPDGDVLSYSWSLGDGKSATGKTVSHAYAAAGTYTVKLTVSDGKASASTSQSVKVEAIPAFTATFAPSPNNNEWWVDVKVTSNHSPVKVEAKHSGGSYVGLDATGWGTWAKSFHAPAGGEMVFRATDAYGQRVVSQPFPWLEAPNQPPIASFKASSSGLAASLDASASSDPDGDVLSYSWSLGDGKSAAGKTVSHTYAAAGTYTVKLTVSDGKASASTSQSVTVKAPFSATFEPTSSVNEWWVDVKVTSQSPVTKVEAKAGSGSWISLDKTSWGTWAKSIHVPTGTPVVFRATDDAGQTAVSETFPWLGKQEFSATFTPVNKGTPKMVRVDVDANADVAKVHVRQDGGKWTLMSQRSDGVYVVEMRAKNAHVEFRATSILGDRAFSDPILWR